MTTTIQLRQPKGIVALFPELLAVGGIQEAGRLTAAALHGIALKYGCSAEFLSLNDPAGPQILRSSEIEVPFRGFSRAKLSFALSALKLARNGTRIVVVTHPHLALPASQMKLLNRHLRMVTISHGVEAWNRLPWARWTAFRKSDFFLAPSSYTAEKISEAQGVPQAKTRRLAWPLSPEVLRMADNPEHLDPPRGFPEGLVVLTVTRLEVADRYKGIDKLIEAIARIRTQIDGLHLVIVATGNDLPRHVKLASDLGIAGCVHFFEGLSRVEIAGCYSRCDVFAMPSTGEGFGLVFLEAMAFGKPVIGANAGGIPDVIEDGMNGFLVRAADLEQLCQVLTSLLTDEHLRGELGRKSAQLARAKYQFENFAAQLEVILRDCGLESDS